MKKRSVIYNYFVIDDTAVIFKKENGDVYKKPHELEHYFQLHNLDIHDEQTKDVIEEAKPSEYIDQFWVKLFEYHETVIPELLNYHFNSAKDKRKYWHAIESSLTRSPVAMFGTEVLSSGLNQPFKNKTNIVIKWLHETYDKLLFVPIALWEGSSDNQLDEIYGFLTQGNERYMTNNFDEFKAIMKGNYKYGARINIESLPKSMVVYFFDELSAKTSLINSEYLDKYDRLKPVVLAQLIACENQPVEAKTITRARADYGKTEVRITHRKFMKKLEEFLNQL
jgi:hypothetical protein